MLTNRAGARARNPAVFWDYGQVVLTLGLW